MKYQIKKISELTPSDRNSRTHSKRQVEKIAASIKEFKFMNPIIIDSAGEIIAGHGRLEAATLLGIEEVPTLLADHLTPAQVKAYRIADNRLALDAGWHDDLLKIELEELQSLDFDLGMTGFEQEEIDALFGIESSGLTDEDEVPPTPIEPVSMLGDVWLLGDHRLMCGDSTILEQVETLMAGQKADMVFTDPPYQIQTQGGCKGEIGKSLKKQASEIDFISNFNPEKFLDLLPKVFNKNQLNAYIFCNKDLLLDYLNWAKNGKFSFNVLVWKKPNAIPIGDSHRPDIEYLLVFRKSAIWNGGIKDVNYSRCIEHGRETGLHPTMKPVPILENQLKISSNSKSPVLDLFGGSGSTLIACEKTKRHARLMEIDPNYVDVIIRRWEDFTGKTAILEADGKTFAKTEKARKK